MRFQELNCIHYIEYIFRWELFFLLHMKEFTEDSLHSVKNRWGKSPKSDLQILTISKCCIQYNLGLAGLFASLFLSFVYIPFTKILYHFILDDDGIDEEHEGKKKHDIVILSSKLSIWQK